MLLPLKISIDNETKKSDRLGRANYYIVYENSEIWPNSEFAREKDENGFQGVQEELSRRQPFNNRDTDDLKVLSCNSGILVRCHNGDVISVSYKLDWEAEREPE